MWNRNFALALAANFTFWVCFFAHVALYPLYLSGKGFGEGAIGNIIALASVGALIGRVVSGWAIDRWGAKNFILAGAIISGAFSPLMVLSNSGLLLSLYRVMLGFGLGIFTNATLAHITYITPVANRGRAVSWWGIMNNTANAIIPPLASVVLLRSSFLVTFSLAGGAALLAAGMSTKLTAPSSLPQTSSKFKVFTRPAVFPGVIAGAIGFAAGAFISFSPLIGQQLGLSNPGLYLTVYAIANLVGQFTSGPISDQWGRRMVIVPGMLLLAAALTMLGVPLSARLALVTPFLFGLGMGSAVPGILAWAVDLCAPHERGLANSTVLILWELFVTAGIVFQGQMMQAALAFTGFQVMGGLVAVALGLYLFQFLPPRAQKKAAV